MPPCHGVSHSAVQPPAQVEIAGRANNSQAAGNRVMVFDSRIIGSSKWPQFPETPYVGHNPDRFPTYCLPTMHSERPPLPRVRKASPGAFSVLTADGLGQRVHIPAK